MLTMKAMLNYIPFKNIVYSSLFHCMLLAIDCMVDYPIGMERFFGWDAKIKKVIMSVCVCVCVCVYVCVHAYKCVCVPDMKNFLLIMKFPFNCVKVLNTRIHAPLL